MIATQPPSNGQTTPSPSLCLLRSRGYADPGCAGRGNGANQRPVLRLHSMEAGCIRNDGTAHDRETLLRQDRWQHGDRLVSRPNRSSEMPTQSEAGKIRRRRGLVGLETSHRETASSNTQRCQWAERSWCAVTRRDIVSAGSPPLSVAIKVQSSCLPFV